MGQLCRLFYSNLFGPVHLRSKRDFILKKVKTVGMLKPMNLKILNPIFE